MGLLDGKNALIFGVANDHSIAWGIARAFHDAGATVGFSSVESLIERRVRPLAASIGSTFVEPCDVQSDDEIRAVMAKWGAAHGRLDILVHALAFARREDLEGSFVDTSRDGFTLALARPAGYDSKPCPGSKTASKKASSSPAWISSSTGVGRTRSGR